MEVTPPCTMCRSHKDCSCRNALVSFLGILQGVSDRILTLKSASRAQQSPLAGAGLDKLKARFTTLPTASEIFDAAKRLQLEIKMTPIENKMAVKVGNSKTFIHLTLDPSRSFVAGLISNPNRFKSWDAYIHFLENIIPFETLQDAILTRVDLNIDFNLPFSQMIQQIDVKQKSVSVSYEDKGADKTGIYFGKGSEVLVIYDKAKKDRLDSSHSRVELRLSGSKLPTKSLYNLRQHLSENEFFTKIEGHHVEINSSVLAEVQNQKLQDFQSILRREGLFAARKAMSRNRNFSRDFTNSVKLVPWSSHPSEIFKRGIQSFLGTNTSESESLH